MQQRLLKAAEAAREAGDGAPTNEAMPLSEGAGESENNYQKGTYI